MKGLWRLGSGFGCVIGVFWRIFENILLILIIIELVSDNNSTSCFSSNFSLIQDEKTRSKFQQFFMFS